MGIGVAVVLVAAGSVLTGERVTVGTTKSTASAPGASPTHAVKTTRVKMPQSGVDEPLTTLVPLDCEVPKGTAATVNERPIEVVQVCNRLRFLTGGSSPAAGRQVLEQLIEAELFIGALEDRGMQISEADIRAELSRLAGDTGAANQAAAAADLARSELRASARERVARRLLVDALGHLEPTATDLRAAAPRPHDNAVVEAWIARLPSNASNEASARAQRNAAAGWESLLKGDEPLQQGLSRLPSFDLVQGSGEPALEAAVFAPGGSQWQRPVRTRAGWVVARAVSIERVQRGSDQSELHHAAETLVRQREEQRISSALRAAATIVRFVQ
jgi:hypothetical protein